VKHALTGMNVEVSAAPPVLAKTANQTLDFASITTVMEQQFPVQHFLKNFLKEDLLKDKEDLLNKKPQKKKAQNLAHVHVKMLNFAIMMVEQTLDYVNHAQTMKFLLIAVEMVFQNLELQLARHNVSLLQHFLKDFLKENLLKDKEDLLNKMPQLMQHQPQKKKAQHMVHVHVEMVNSAIMMVDPTLDSVNLAQTLRQNLIAMKVDFQLMEL
jgi:uncharacterized glyoxalase superfamily protein PhnB